MILKPYLLTVIFNGNSLENEKTGMNLIEKLKLWDLNPLLSSCLFG